MAQCEATAERHAKESARANSALEGRVRELQREAEGSRMEVEAKERELEAKSREVETRERELSELKEMPNTLKEEASRAAQKAKEEVRLQGYHSTLQCFPHPYPTSTHHPHPHTLPHPYLTPNTYLNPNPSMPITLILTRTHPLLSLLPSLR